MQLPGYGRFAGLVTNQCDGIASSPAASSTASRSPTCPTTQFKNLRETVLMGLSMVVGVAAGVPANQTNCSNGCSGKYLTTGQGHVRQSAYRLATRTYEPASPPLPLSSLGNEFARSTLARGCKL